GVGLANLILKMRRRCRTVDCAGPSVQVLPGALMNNLKTSLILGFHRGGGSGLRVARIPTFSESRYGRPAPKFCCGLDLGHSSKEPSVLHSSRGFQGSR